MKMKRSEFLYFLWNRLHQAKSSEQVAEGGYLVRKHCRLARYYVRRPENIRQYRVTSYFNHEIRQVVGKVVVSARWDIDETCSSKTFGAA